MQDLSVIVLAAGESTRLKSKTSKLLHPLCGRPLISYVMDTALALKPSKVCLVVGHQRENIEKLFSDSSQVVFAHQTERLGTGHAATIGLKALGNPQGSVLILNGDVPLLSVQTLKSLIRKARRSALSLATAVLPDPFGYGRILRDAHGDLQGIVEEKNASSQEKQLNEINTGIYLVEAKFLRGSLEKIPKDPLKKEYYLTEIVRLARESHIMPITYIVENIEEILGVNTRSELAHLNQRMRARLAAYHLEQGVGMEDPHTLYLDAGVKIGVDTFLESGVHLKGETRLGLGCHIETGAVLRDCQVGNGVTVKAYSVLEGCRVAQGAVIGPFARVRPETQIGEGARVGNFVELKKTRLGAGAKASHLSYLGDAKIGAGANIGAGTITCNYDGKNKFLTVIGAKAFIGSDTQLVAPVKVGEGAYVGAGTTLTQDVPSGHLALSRVPQKNLLRRKK